MIERKPALASGGKESLKVSPPGCRPFGIVYDLNVVKQHDFDPPGTDIQNVRNLVQSR